jgi:hypothetical protein
MAGSCCGSYCAFYHLQLAEHIGSLVALAAAATPIARLEMDIIPSFDPKTAALNQLLRFIMAI